MLGFFFFLETRRQNGETSSGLTFNRAGCSCCCMPAICTQQTAETADQWYDSNVRHVTVYLANLFPTPQWLCRFHRKIAQVIFFKMHLVKLRSLSIILPVIQPCRSLNEERRVRHYLWAPCCQPTQQLWTMCILTMTRTFSISTSFFFFSFLLQSNDFEKEMTQISKTNLIIASAEQSSVSFFHAAALEEKISFLTMTDFIRNWKSRPSCF